jgi:hypothetical protein
MEPMNITLNISPENIERLITAVERVATAAEHLAFPMQVVEPKPYPATDWMESSNAQSRAVEEEERREEQGFGPAYERKLEAAAIDLLKRAGLEPPPSHNRDGD